VALTEVFHRLAACQSHKPGPEGYKIVRTTLNSSIQHPSVVQKCDRQRRSRCVDSYQWLHVAARWCHCMSEECAVLQIVANRVWCQSLSKASGAQTQTPDRLAIQEDSANGYQVKIAKFLETFSRSHNDVSASK